MFVPGVGLLIASLFDCDPLLLKDQQGEENALGAGGEAVAGLEVHTIAADP